MAITAPNADQVSRDLEMRMLLDNGVTVPMPCTLNFTLADPYAVSATFRSARASVTWVFARELLASGVLRESGEGDIHITPLKRTSGDVVRIELRSPDGRAVMEGPRFLLDDFLRSTYDLLPNGLEWSYLNLDAALEQLLNDEMA